LRAEAVACSMGERSRDREQVTVLCAFRRGQGLSGRCASRTSRVQSVSGAPTQTIDGASRASRRAVLKTDPRRPARGRRRPRSCASACAIEPVSQAGGTFVKGHLGSGGGAFAGHAPLHQKLTAIADGGKVVDASRGHDDSGISASVADQAIRKPAGRNRIETLPRVVEEKDGRILRRQRRLEGDALSRSARQDAEPPRGRGRRRGTIPERVPSSSRNVRWQCALASEVADRILSTRSTGSTGSRVRRKADGSRGGTQQTGHHAEQCRFSCAVRTDERQNLSSIDGQ
jgi:hypothetical protein